MNENCCSVDWGRTIPGVVHLPSSFVPTEEFAIQEKNANAWGLAPGGGGAWAQLELTDALDYRYI